MPPADTTPHGVLAPKSVCAPGQHPAEASQDLPMATERVSVRAEDTLGLPNMQDTVG